MGKQIPPNAGKEYRNIQIESADSRRGVRGVGAALGGVWGAGSGLGCVAERAAAAARAAARALVALLSPTSAAPRMSLCRGPAPTGWGCFWEGGGACRRPRRQRACSMSLTAGLRVVRQPSAFGRGGAPHGPRNRHMQRPGRSLFLGQFSTRADRGLRSASLGLREGRRTHAPAPSLALGFTCSLGPARARSVG